MDIIEDKIKIKKENLPVCDSLKSTYFDSYARTMLGDKYMYLSSDEFFILMLTCIDIDIGKTIDKCMLNKDEVAKRMISMILKIAPGVTVNIDITDVENPLQLKILKHTVRKNTYYDFNMLYHYVHDSIENPNIYVIKKILKIYDKQGTNLLRWYLGLTFYLSETFVMFLLDHCDVSYDKKHGRPSFQLLIRACYTKLQNVALRIIDMFGTECHLGKYDSIGNTALMLACKNNLKDVVFKLVDTFDLKCKPYHRNVNDYTALIISCKSAEPEIIFKLIDTFGTECRPEQHDVYGGTALIYACECSTPEVIVRLIDTFGMQCDPENRNNSGKNALMIACSYRDEITAMKLLDTFGRDSCASLFVDWGSHQGTTALMEACEYRLENVAIKMIDTLGSACNPGSIDKHKRTALIIACIGGMQNVALRIIDKFGINCKPQQRCSVLHTHTSAFELACKNNLEDVALKLIKNFGAYCEITKNILDCAKLHNMSRLLPIIDQTYYSEKIPTITPFLESVATIFFSVSACVIYKILSQ